jgi:hypothetical protein
MAYTTPTATGAMLVGVTLDTATAALVTECIAWADNEINATLAKRFSVSDFASDVPPQIASLSKRIAVGHYWQHGTRGNKESLARGQAILKDARSDLKELADGKAQLVDSDGATISRRGSHPGVLSNTVDYTSTFAEDDPIKWKVDPDKKTDIASERD